MTCKPVMVNLYFNLTKENYMHRRDLHKYSRIGMVAILIILILDAINISSILTIPFNNINLDLWNILVVIILYVLTCEIIQKRDNCRKKNQEEFARILLENTYRECYLKI